jgi:hypothetical protein
MIAAFGLYSGDAYLLKAGNARNYESLLRPKPHQDQIMLILLDPQIDRIISGYMPGRNRFIKILPRLLCTMVATC